LSHVGDTFVPLSLEGFVRPATLLRRRLATAAILPDQSNAPACGGRVKQQYFSWEGCNVTEFDIGEFFIRGEAREIDGEFQAVIVMRAKPPLKTVTYHQVEKDRWFKSSDIAALAAQQSALELKAAVDAGALKS
jgi:hypothetical protein